jgi:hypothetical protein
MTSKILANILSRLSLFSLIVSFLACAKDAPISISKPPILLCVGSDVSGTFANHPKLSPQHLSRLCEAVAESGSGGLVAVYPIGNPTDSPFVRCRILPMKALNPNAILSVQAQQAKECKLVKAANRREIQAFTLRYTHSIYKLANQQETDLQGFLRKAADLANEPIFDAYTKRIFIYSDAHDDVKGRKKLLIPAENDLKNIKFYGCGIQNESLLSRLKIQKFESPEGFIESQFINF